MIVVFVLLGIAAGWLVSLAGDYLIRSQTKIRSMQKGFRLPAILRPSLNAEVVLEVGCGVAFAVIFARYGLTATALVLMLITAFFALIAIIDYKYRLVLNILTYPGIVIALVVNIFVLNRPPLPFLLGMVLAFGVFFLTERVRPGGMGGGDTKLAALIGAALGFPQVLFALIVMALAAALAIVFMVGVQKRTFQASIPFAPFMCLGAVVIFILLTPM